MYSYKEVKGAIRVLFENPEHSCIWCFPRKTIYIYAAYLVIHTHFICFTAACNIISVHRKPNKVLFIPVAFKCSHLLKKIKPKQNKLKTIKSLQHLKSIRHTFELVSEIRKTKPYMCILFHIPEAKSAISRCRSKLC